MNQYSASKYGTKEAVDFLNGTATDDQGRTVADYLAFDAETWERCHNHIQWAFPSHRPSQFNPNAPVVTISDLINGLNSDGHSNLLKLHDAFLATLGITHSEKVGELYHWDTGSHLYTFDGKTIFWLNEYDHNHLRITRVLLLLQYIDECQANALLKMLMDLAINGINLWTPRRVVFTAETMAYWYKAVHDDSN